MFYEPGRTPHGLPFNPFKSCVVPRPIGWISTLDANGVANLAPYSQFQNVTFDPPIVMFSANQTSSGTRKDSTVNAEREGSFVWNMATFALREAVNISSGEYPPGVDEFAEAGLTKAPSRLIRPPRVAESPVQFECEYMQTVRLPGGGVMGTVDVVFGRVIAVHIDDAALTADGKLDIPRLRPLARLGYHDYTSVDHSFTMPSPNSGAGGAGLEGSPEKANALLGTGHRAVQRG
ncbi:flavin reductase family protein [Roseomonas sp. BN140053]|uniref:flavin reductase family protein n=1 Tax=Roseomonas sp. BN140053 TaxID=3391898 RepID=UPI0039EBF84B